MTRFRILMLTLGLLIPLAGCSRPHPDYTDQFLALGTIVSVTFYNVDHELARTAVADVKQNLAAFTESWHAWGDGRLGKLNDALRKGECEKADPALLNAIRKAQQLTRNSNRHFEPGIGRLVEAWQFHVDERPADPPPAANDITALVNDDYSVLDLAITNDSVCAEKPGLVIDFGGFAKGLAVDEAIRVLQAHGITNAIVNAGGDLRAIGRHGDRPWKIGIRNPEAGGYLASVEVSGDASVFTSGDYERWFEYEGQRYHHILDPATGYPANELRSVTVIGTDASVADAAATALFVAGAQTWPEVAADFELTDVFVVTRDGEYQGTASMQQRIRFEADDEVAFVARELP